MQMKLLEVKRASARVKLLVVMGVGNVEIVVVIHVETLNPEPLNPKP